jgi:hypothetical protein
MCELYDKTSRILLSEIPQHDAHERVGLLSVIAGVRAVALFLAPEETDAQKLRRLLRSYRLTSIITPGPHMAYTWDCPHPPEIVKLFRQPKKSRALWVCRDSEHLTGLKTGIDQLNAGRLLGYPGCCIEAHQHEHARFETAVIAAYMESFDSDPERIARALSNNLKVRMEWESGDRIARTEARFPFVQHTACEACLSSQSSPTADLNNHNQDLVAETDRTLHDYLLRIAGKRTNLSSGGTVI